MRALVSLDQETVVFALSVLADVLTKANLLDRRWRGNLGAWSWGLLARCREVGTLGSEDVGVLREVGKQAGWVMRRVVVEAGSWGGGAVEEEELEEEMEVIEEEEEEVAEEDVEDIEARKKGLLDSLREEAGEEDDYVAGEGGAVGEEGAKTEDWISDAVEDGELAQGDGLNIGDAPEGPEKSPQADILATLDAILTIVGEEYGQRDLLDGRLLWDEL